MSGARTFVEESYAQRLEWRTWRRVLGYALGYRRELAGLVAAVAVVAGAEAVFPLVTRSAIDRVIAGDPAAADLRPHVALYAALVVLLSSSVWLFIRLAGKLATHVAHDIRRDAFSRLQDLSFGFYDRRPVGWLMARMTSDCDRLSRIVAWGMVDLTWSCTLLVATGSVLVSLSPRLALVVAMVLPPLVWVSFVFQRRILATARLVRKSNARLTAAFNEALMGARTTKVLGREEAALGDFRDLSQEMYQASVRNALQSAVYLPLVITLGTLATALALAAGGIEVQAMGLSLGTLVAFLTYARLVFDPIHDLARNFAELQMAGASAERVIGLIEAVPEIGDSAEVSAGAAAAAADGDAGAAGPERIGAIELRDVGFAYAGGPPVLAGVSLTARPGETIALVGPTGGGKTTIVSLLCRFYEPTAGAILLGGVEYRERPLAWLQSRLAVVLQTPHLFRGSVLDNIRYGRLEASDEEVIAAARAAEAHDFITALEDGYASDVGEGGGRLSTGQKQLVSFARALLKRPEVLILDEATASIDAETERRVQRALERVLDGPTSFVIAHRLSTIRAADQILVVASGRIVEAGRHGDLMRKGGTYHALYTGQRLSDALGDRATWGPESPPPLTPSGQSA